MQMSANQIDAVNELAANGWKITSQYNDGIMKMHKDVDPTREGSHPIGYVRVGVFVRQDGTLSPPDTQETMIIQAALHDLGFKFYFGKSIPEPPENLQIINPEEMNGDTRDAYIAWIAEVLIPDLRDSTLYNGIADEFEVCIRLIRELEMQREDTRRTAEQSS